MLTSYLNAPKQLINYGGLRSNPHYEVTIP